VITHPFQRRFRAKDKWGQPSSKHLVLLQLHFLPQLSDFSLLVVRNPRNHPTFIHHSKSNKRRVGGCSCVHSNAGSEQRKSWANLGGTRSSSSSTSFPSFLTSPRWLSETQEIILPSSSAPNQTKGGWGDALVSILMLVQNKDKQGQPSWRHLVLLQLHFLPYFSDFSSLVVRNPRNHPTFLHHSKPNKRGVGRCSFVHSYAVSEQRTSWANLLGGTWFSSSSTSFPGFPTWFSWFLVAFPNLTGMQPAI
jgi:hypothetical protein